MRKIRFILMKEIQQLRRDPRLFGILLAAPLFQLLILGYAATTDLRGITLAVRDADRSRESRELVQTIAASNYFTWFMAGGPEADDGGYLISGKAGLVLSIPPGFGRRLGGGSPVPVQVLVDGAESNAAIQGLNYLQKAVRLYNQRLAAGSAALVPAEARPARPAVAAETRVWFNPDLTSRFYMVPGVMGVLLLVTTMLVTSMAIVKEREEGTMEQLLVTPLRAGELIVGKLLPFVLIGFVEITMALPVMLLIFQVPLRGSLLLLYGISGLFLLNTLGLGLLLSSLVRTQQQAMMLAAFIVMMPFVLLSGFIFPVANMPHGFQQVAAFIPLKYYLTAVRGIFLKGAGWPDLWPQFAALLLSGTAILSLAVLNFRKLLN